MRDARRESLQESTNEVQECKAMAEEVSWSGLSLARQQIRKMNHGDSKGNVGSSPGAPAAILGRSAVDSDDEGNKLDLDVEEVNRVRFWRGTLLEQVG